MVRLTTWSVVKATICVVVNAASCLVDKVTKSSVNSAAICLIDMPASCAVLRLLA